MARRKVHHHNPKPSTERCEDCARYQGEKCAIGLPKLQQEQRCFHFWPVLLVDILKEDK